MVFGYTNGAFSSLVNVIEASILVHFDREKSNALFEELADWNEVLKHSEADLRGPNL